MRLMMLLSLMLICMGLVLVSNANAQQPDWRAQERQCMAQCPGFPRYSGIETDAEYWSRMQAQAAHDSCKMRCAAQSAEQFSESFVPISQAAADYYKRNDY